MTINADGSHAVQPHTANAHTAPARPVRHAVVEEEVLEPLGPVEGWGFTNRVILVSVLVVIIGNVVRVLTGDLGDPNGSVALGETGRGWVVLVQSFMFGLVGGALAGAAGYLWLGFEVVIPVAGVLLLIAHRPLVQDLQDAWLTRRPRRR